MPFAGKEAFEKVSKLSRAFLMEILADTQRKVLR
jgi:hypothetical protein